MKDLEICSNCYWFREELKGPLEELKLGKDQVCHDVCIKDNRIIGVGPSHRCTDFEKKDD